MAAVLSFATIGGIFYNEISDLNSRLDGVIRAKHQQIDLAKDDLRAALRRINNMKLLLPFTMPDDVPEAPPERKD